MKEAPQQPTVLGTQLPGPRRILKMVTKIMKERGERQIILTRRLQVTPAEETHMLLPISTNLAISSFFSQLITEKCQLVDFCTSTIFFTTNNENSMTQTRAQQLTSSIG